MNGTNRLVRVAWIFLAVLAGFSLGVLFLNATRPAGAQGGSAAGDSEGDPDVAARAASYVPDEFLPRSPSVTDVVTQTLYYAPLDSNNHNTILFFHNTRTITSTIDLDFQTDTGAACLSGVVFDIPPGDSARVSADALDPGRPASWANTIVYNMFDTCEIGLIKMPNTGVSVAGYVAWTPIDTYNPRELNPHAEIRFSTDPYSIFLSTLNTSP